MPREYPITLTAEEIEATADALRALDEEYGLRLGPEAPKWADAEERRQYVDAQYERGRALIEKVATAAKLAAELEPTR